MFHIHVFKFVKRSGAYIYKECRCGKRAYEYSGAGHSPIDWEWLKI